MASTRGLTAAYRPLVLMSASIPDRRRVSLAAVNTLAPSGIRSLTRSTRGGDVVEDFHREAVRRSASAARSSRSAGAGSVNEAGPSDASGAAPASGVVSRYRTS